MSKDTAGENRIAEISGILHGQKDKTDKLEQALKDFSSEQAGMASDLDDLISKASSLCDEVGVAFPKSSLSTSSRANIHLVPPVSLGGQLNWDTLVQEYDPFVQAQPCLDALLPPDLVRQIEKEFDKPLARSPWDKWDATVVFGAALVGIVVDWFCAPLGNPLSDKLRSYGTTLHDKGGVESGFSQLQKRLSKSPLAGKFEWVDKIAKMDVSHDNLPIDYSGKHFGGNYHRGLSPGHDLLRFMSGIWQIKNGQFIGTRFEFGQAIMEVQSVSQRGNVYAGTQDWQTAAILYLLHVIADFFTKTSLPVPGATLLREIPSRDIRKFVSDMYEGKIGGVRSEHGGVNLRHLVGQSVTPTVVSLVIWLYHLIRYRIGGWWANRQGHPYQEEAVKGLKLNEMMATAHTIVTGVNVGKVIVTENPTMLNVPELIVCMKHLSGLAVKTLQRRSPQARFERNQLILADGWDRVEAYVASPIASDEIDWPESPIVISGKVS